MRRIEGALSVLTALSLAACSGKGFTPQVELGQPSAEPGEAEPGELPSLEPYYRQSTPEPEIPLYEEFLNQPFMEIVEEATAGEENLPFQEKMTRGLEYIVNQVYPGIQALFPDLTEEDKKELYAKDYFIFSEKIGPEIYPGLIEPWRLEYDKNGDLSEVIFQSAWEDASSLEALSWIIGILPPRYTWVPTIKSGESGSEPTIGDLYIFGFSITQRFPDGLNEFIKFHRAAAESIAYWVWLGRNYNQRPVNYSDNQRIEFVTRLLISNDMNIGDLTYFYYSSQLYVFLAALIDQGKDLNEAYNFLEDRLVDMEYGDISPQDLAELFYEKFHPRQDLEGNLFLPPDSDNELLRQFFKGWDLKKSKRMSSFQKA